MGPIVTRPVQDPLAVLLLANRLYIMMHYFFHKKLNIFKIPTIIINYQTAGDQEKRKEVVTKVEEQAPIKEEPKPKETAPVQKPVEKKVPVLNGSKKTTTTAPKPTPPVTTTNKPIKPVKTAPPKTTITPPKTTVAKPGTKEVPKIIEPATTTDEKGLQGPEGIQSSMFDGENWQVTISSKHELETSSDMPHKTVTIRPKTPPPVEVKKTVVAATAAVKQVKK